MLIEIKPADHLIAGCFGEPGDRTLYIQTAKLDEIVTLLCEKFQVQQLANSIQDFIDKMYDKDSTINISDIDQNSDQLKFMVPLEPLFRVGEIGIGYDEKDELMFLRISKLASDDEYLEDDFEHVTVRIWATVEKMYHMAKEGQLSVAGGRPICGNCMQPIDPHGHFCPKSNGHQ